MAAHPTDLAKHLIQASALGLTVWSGGKAFTPAVLHPSSQEPPTQRQFSAGAFLGEYENILGTSMELRLTTGSPVEAQECEWRVLGEIERLRGILSTYDPASEIRQVMAGAPIISQELSELLNLYTQWTQRTAGAINVNMGEVSRLWKMASTSGRVPTQSALRAAARRPRAYNVDALGKGFIIDRAVEIARRFAPIGLLNIGGDIRVWGAEAWLIGVANPFNPADNAAPLAQFLLREGAVATSGGYARFFALNEKKFSHLIDPRSLRPISSLASATVMAPDCVTANALSTAACVLDPKLGAEIARCWGSIEHLLVDSAGSIQHTGTFVLADTSATPIAPPTLKTPPAAISTGKTPADKPAVPVGWPKDYQVNVTVSIKASQFSFRGFKRPYVAIWIENADKKVVRTLTVWGTNNRYLSTLSGWWQATARSNFAAIASVTRATRPAGQYNVLWDGLDDKGKPVPVGEYKINFEINREHGTHAMESVLLHCADQPQTAELRQTTETDAAKIVYGPISTSAKK